MTKHEQIKECISVFQAMVILNPEFEHLDIQSVFIDHKNGERRAVIITSDKTDLETVKEIVAPYFKGVRYKVIHQHGSAEFSASTLLTGHAVQHFDSQSWGTVGGFFKGASGDVYGVSNTHVLTNFGAGSKGDKIRYEPNITAGTLFDFYTLTPRTVYNVIDGAVFKVDTANNNMDHINIDIPIPLVGARVNMAVKKTGATTGETFGNITSVAGTAKVTLAGKDYWFSGVIAIKANNKTQGDFNQPGDSGSIVRTDPGGHITAIVFAKKGKYCWALPFSPIRDLIA